MLKGVYPYSRMKIEDYEEYPGAGADLEEVEFLRESLWLQQENEAVEKDLEEILNDGDWKESWKKREEEGMICLFEKLNCATKMANLKKPAAELAQEVISANDEMEIAAPNDTSDGLILQPMINMLAERDAMSPKTFENMDKIWDRARLDHEESWRQAGQILPDDVLILNSGQFTPAEVSLCNAIPLLALVRFVCILTPTSFSLFTLQDEIILLMHAENNGRGVWTRIGDELGRDPASVQQRYYRLLEQKVLEPKAKLNSGQFTPAEVSLCNAIPLLALVRFVCILTPTSFSLFTLQDEIILLMHAENNGRGVWKRIGDALSRDPSSVRARYIILSRKTGARS